MVYILNDTLMSSGIPIGVRAHFLFYAPCSRCYFGLTRSRIPPLVLITAPVFILHILFTCAALFHKKPILSHIILIK